MKSVYFLKVFFCCNCYEYFYHNYRVIISYSAFLGQKKSLVDSTRRSLNMPALLPALYSKLI